MPHRLKVLPDCLKVWMHVFSIPGGIQAAAPRNICRKIKPNEQKVQSTETLHSKNSRQLVKFADKNSHAKASC
jgi:hypothetical protein